MKIALVLVALTASLCLMLSTLYFLGTNQWLTVISSLLFLVMFPFTGYVLRKWDKEKRQKVDEARRRQFDDQANRLRASGTPDDIIIDSRTGRIWFVDPDKED